MGSLLFSRLNYCWRLVATGGCFAIFSLGGFALWAFVFPAVSAACRRTCAERTRWIIHKSFGAFLWLMETVGIMRMEVDGAEKLRDCGGMLVLANHPTLIDVVALISLMPDASCVVKQSLWLNPFLGGVVRAAGYLSNSDSDSLIDDCARDLRHGKPLIIFPEGTRTSPGEPLRFQRGASHIALRSQASVIPVIIDCNPTTLTKREKWYQIPPRRFHLRIHVLDPVRPEHWVEPRETQAIAARKLTRALEVFFSQELTRWTC
jgi:1-acyl-sn-glycerol-3-phosphate acyltransferase